MRKMLFVIALMVFASSAFGIEFNAGRAPVIVSAGATADSVMVTSTEPYGLPTSFTAFTGNGDEFGVYFWGDWDDNGTYEWTSAAVQVPGSITMPRISQSQNRSGTWYTGWRFSCATDDVTVIKGDR